MKLQAFDEANILIPGIFSDSYFDSSHSNCFWKDKILSHCFYLFTVPGRGVSGICMPYAYFVEMSYVSSINL